MVSGGRAVFKYVLEIKDMLTKGRQVVQMNNQITGSTQKASVATDKYSSSVQGAGRSSAAAAVNFQTMTQGMLNLSTAGIQTFTSISNLNRFLSSRSATVIISGGQPPTQAKVNFLSQKPYPHDPPLRFPTT